ncbi:hypothetical protein [Pseudomonas phage vB_Pae_BR228a]|nr:hypothetical protein [Pseudomonas phage vB_Pae_CF24a]QBI82493.1 hypothetical protein [Pseudomonas phage vB_Pae_CF69a]QBI82611.1 hypothetical protein [Pseudomonas phage vB_Pae_BR228a]QBI82683.1 hypothetical protein [Pseudomonas phage vB_Pae_BR197a]QBI82937.1 hypothetical protein [Pseudomonas phage vB_Pae_BR320a]QBI83064.1 hypothetical protein [Pseudomonas phage vB_Pae_BR150a]DBA08553.1 TPA_asm: hypothetical protein [Pseudomonas phage vB_PaeP-D14I]
MLYEYTVYVTDRRMDRFGVTMKTVPCNSSFCVLKVEFRSQNEIVH